MDIQLINEALLDLLQEQAKGNERLRQNFDLRTTPADTSQRLLNALQPGTQVPIHRHETTSETIICLQGRLDVVFFDQVDDAFVEKSPVSLSPLEGRYGVQIPPAAWHTVEVYEPSVIFEAKDGAFKG